jgi:2-polyprenyl-3-methyl-5-hydroxy-6-metoxy-1,4-benzoquinol methylase
MVDINLLCPALNKQRLLDVGCASGEFLHVLNSKYKWPATNLRGVEPSEISASDANKKYKINVQNCPAESLVIDHNSFDLITILNSIEHFSDPRLVLRQLRNIIRPHGMLFIGTVPNVNSLPSLLFPEGFIAKNMPDGQHHYQFCPETLSQLCKLEGYSVISLLGRRRDIVGNNAEMVAKWLAYSCGVPVNKLINPKKLLQEFEKRVHFGQELALRKGEKYLYKINDYDFESFEASISFWRREIWSSPYLSDAFDIWLCPQS